jgi:hypothetical protein
MGEVAAAQLPRIQKTMGTGRAVPGNNKCQVRSPEGPRADGIRESTGRRDSGMGR